jgi:hypothetical protein
MGLNFSKSDFTITDENGNIKFSIDRKMPIMLQNISGTLSVSKILAENPAATIVNRRDEFILSTSTEINNQNYVIFPYFRVNGGVSDTGQTVICGGGSIVLRVIRQPSTGLYLGSSLLSVVVEPNLLKLRVDHALDRTNFTNISGDDIINLAYRVHYGRFS